MDTFVYLHLPSELSTDAVQAIAAACLRRDLLDIAHGDPYRVWVHSPLVVDDVNANLSVEARCWENGPELWPAHVDDAGVPEHVVVVTRSSLDEAGLQQVVAAFDYAAMRLGGRVLRESRVCRDYCGEAPDVPRNDRGFIAPVHEWRSDFLGLLQDVARKSGVIGAGYQ